MKAQYAALDRPTRVRLDTHHTAVAQLLPVKRSVKITVRGPDPARPEDGMVPLKDVYVELLGVSFDPVTLPPGFDSLADDARLYAKHLYPPIESRTDENGEVIMKGLPPLIYVVTTKKPGYRTPQMAIVPDANELLPGTFPVTLMPDLRTKVDVMLTSPYPSPKIAPVASLWLEGIAGTATAGIERMKDGGVTVPPSSTWPLGAMMFTFTGTDHLVPGRYRVMVTDKKVATSAAHPALEGTFTTTVEIRFRGDAAFDLGVGEETTVELPVTPVPATIRGKFFRAMDRAAIPVTGSGAPSPLDRWDGPAYQPMMQPGIQFVESVLADLLPPGLDLVSADAGVDGSFSLSVLPGIYGVKIPGSPDWGSNYRATFNNTLPAPLVIALGWPYATAAGTIPVHPWGSAGIPLNSGDDVDLELYIRSQRYYLNGNVIVDTDSQAQDRVVARSGATSFHTPFSHLKETLEAVWNENGAAAPPTVTVDLTQSESIAVDGSRAPSSGAHFLIPAGPGTHSITVRNKAGISPAHYTFPLGTGGTFTIPSYGTVGSGAALVGPFGGLVPLEDCWERLPALPDAIRPDYTDAHTLEMKFYGKDGMGAPILRFTRTNPHYAFHPDLDDILIPIGQTTPIKMMNGTWTVWREEAGDWYEAEVTLTGGDPAGKVIEFNLTAEWPLGAGPLGEPPSPEYDLKLAAINEDDPTQSIRNLRVNFGDDPDDGPVDPLHLYTSATAGTSLKESWKGDFAPLAILSTGTGSSAATEWRMAFGEQVPPTAYDIDYTPGTPRPLVTVTLRMERGSSVEGTIKAAPPLGTPGYYTENLAGARVQLRNRFGRLLATLTTEPDGTFKTVPPLAVQQIIFVEVDAKGYLPKRFRVTPAPTDTPVMTPDGPVMSFNIGETILERLPQPDFPGLTDVFDRKGMFLVGVSKGTVAGGTAFGPDPHVKMTYTAEAAVPAPPASTTFQGYDLPNGDVNYSPTLVPLPDTITAFWIVGQRYWTENPTQSIGFANDPPYDVYPAVYPPGHGQAGQPHPKAGKVNPLFPVEMKAWLADLLKTPAAGAPRRELFFVRHGAPAVQPNSLLRSTGTIDLSQLPPGLFTPYVIAETRLGSYKVLQVKYADPLANLNLFGMALPSYLNSALDAIGTVSKAQTLGAAKLETSFNFGGFVKFTPQISGDIKVTAAGPYAGTLDYDYALGASFSTGDQLSAGGMLAFLPKHIGMKAGGRVKLKVAGSSSTQNAPGFPSVGLTGEVFGGASADLLAVLAPPIGPPLITGLNLEIATDIGGGLTSTEIGNLPTVDGELYRPLQRRMKFRLEGGVQISPKIKVVQSAFNLIPDVGPVLGELYGKLGTDIYLTDTAAVGAAYSRESTTRYRVPGELLPLPGGAPPDPDAGSVNTYPIGRVEPEETALTQLAGLIGDEILSRPGTNSKGIYGGFSVTAGASLLHQEGSLTLGTAGPPDSIIGLPTLLFELNNFGDFPPIKRVTGSVECTGKIVLRGLWTETERKAEFFSIPVDIPLNTEAIFRLTPFTVTETTRSLTTASPVLWCGAEPHLAANYSPLSPHAAATSGGAQTMAYIDPDSTGGVMSIRIARQLTQGAWSLPETVASAPGIVAVALNPLPGPPGGFVVAWAEVSTAGLTALAPVTTIKYSTSTDGLTWTAPATIGVTTGGTATNLKWLNMAGSTMGLVWQKSERGPGATTLDIQGSFFSGGAFGPILTLYDEADIASWDAIGPGFPEPTTAKIVRLSNTGSLTVADWSGTVLGAPTTLGTVGTAVNCRVTAAPGGIFLVAAADTAGAFKFYKKTGPGAWGALTVPAGLSTADPRELAICTTTSPPGPRFFLTWTEGAGRRHPVFAYIDAFGLLLHGPTHIATDTPGSYGKLLAIPVAGTHAADIHTFFKNGDSGELRAFATTISGLPPSDRDADTLSDLAELRLVDASSTDAFDKIDDITAAADFDGDTYSNGAEFTAGTDAADANSFPAQRLQIEVTVPDAYELSNDAGAVTITRTGHTAVAVTARYTVTGTAANGTDCVLLTGEQIIPAGVSAATIPIVPLSDALAEGTENLTVTLTADAAYTIGATSAAGVTIHDLPFDAWRFTHFTAAELANNAIGGTLGDAESDDTTNLLEYAFDMEPKDGALDDLPISGIVTHPGTSEKHLALAYLRRKNDLELVYVVQIGTNLTGWTDATDAGIEEISVVDHNDGTETITIRDRTPLTTQARRFARVDVRRVP